MGMFDNLKVKADQARAKAADLVDQHSDQIASGMDKAGSFVDQKTGGKHTEKIERAKHQARQGLDSLDGHRDDLPDPAAPPTAAPPTATPPTATPPARDTARHDTAVLHTVHGNTPPTGVPDGEIPAPAM